jgi:hypothetical protein
MRGDSVVPIHLPSLDKGELDSIVSDAPHFVLIVETEEDKEKVKQPLPPGLAKVIARRYSPIGEYRDKYLAALQKVHIISLEHARDLRDRRNIWSIEGLLSFPRLQYIIPVWDKARTETRRQVLDLIGEEPNKGYEYYRGRDLWNIHPRPMFLPMQSVGERIEDCGQAIEILRNDVRAWLHELFEDIL